MTVLRHVEWTIKSDPSRQPPARYITCKDCDEASPVGTEQAKTDRWALDHSGRTGHRRYREMVAADLVTYPTEDPGESGS